MTLTIVREPPDSADARALIHEIVRDVASAYPAESRHGLGPGQLISEGVAFFVVRADGEPAGCGGVKLCEGYGEIKRLYVRPAFRGRGLGQQMLLFLEGYAREHGCHVLYLQTGVYQTDAMRLYGRLGYKEIGPFGSYAGDPMNRFYEKRIP